MSNINSFREGDIVAFKVDENDLSDDKKFYVIEIREKDNKIVISEHGNIKEVSPIELLTEQEVEKIEKEGLDQWNHIIK